MSKNELECPKPHSDRYLNIVFSKLECSKPHSSPYPNIVFVKLECPRTHSSRYSNIAKPKSEYPKTNIRISYLTPKRNPNIKNTIFVYYVLRQNEIRISKKKIFGYQKTDSRISKHRYLDLVLGHMNSMSDAIGRHLCLSAA